MLFNNTSGLDSHDKLAWYWNPYKYDQCEKSYTSKQNLRHINAKHTDERPYKCNECPATFSYLSSHIGHTKRHSEKPYLCELEKMESHPQRVPSESTLSDKTECVLQQYAIIFKVTSLEILRQSNRDVYTEVKPYKCEKYSHKMVHIDAKHHKYEKSYTSKHLLSRHINAKHTERPYKCEECSATFSYLSSHVGHTKRYSEKPYLCEICGKVFRTKNNIDRHSFVHSNKKA
ncbi:PREDICTED: zinc finger protein 761-like [Atta cephalotes]|uniref:C2H2-type domain-containing protein n=1 Tax=Atta cephalotes TaxID=12957 RepID=A0A158P1L9_ATTCE|nr:PREDICTED: zinc finger protein 761-like [Atta cephalotes]